MQSKRIGCRHAGERRHLFVAITSPISQDPRKSAGILPQRRRGHLQYLSTRKASRGPTCQWPRTRTEWGLRTVTGGHHDAAHVYSIIPACVASQLPRLPGFFFSFEKLIIRHGPAMAFFGVFCAGCILQSMPIAPRNLIQQTLYQLQ